MDAPRIGVFGAGAIGSHLGIRLSAAGLPVVLLGRASLVDARDTLSATDRHGHVHRPGPDLVVTDDPAALADVDVCLVTVKGRDTEEAARTIARVARPDVVTVSLQNGLRNPDRLRHHLDVVVAGVVGFNVVADTPGVTVEAVAGDVYLGELPRAGRTLDGLADGLRQAGVRVHISDDIDAVAAGKLLLNLNNGIGGATGLSIAAMLADPDARACFATCIAEGRRVFTTAGTRVARVGRLGPRALQLALQLPSWLVDRLAARVGAIDPRASSSTLADLRRGRPTEIGELNGEIVARAEAIGTTAPANRAVVEIVRTHEAAIAAGRTPEFLPAAALRAELERAMVGAAARPAAPPSR